MNRGLEVWQLHYNHAENLFNMHCASVCICVRVCVRGQTHTARHTQTERLSNVTITRFPPPHPTPTTFLKDNLWASKLQHWINGGGGAKYLHLLKQHHLCSNSHMICRAPECFTVVFKHSKATYFVYTAVVLPVIRGVFKCGHWLAKAHLSGW